MSEAQPGLITRLFCRVVMQSISARLVVTLVFVLLMVFVLGAIFRTPQLRTRPVLVLDPQGNIVEQFSTNPTERALAGLGGNATQEVQLRDLIAVISSRTRFTH